MNLKSLKREINNNSFPTFGDCDFVDWLNTWSEFCIECINDNDANHCLSEYSHCKHISDINDNLFDEYSIRELVSEINNDYNLIFKGASHKDYSKSNYKHCYNKVQKKKVYKDNTKTKNENKDVLSKSGRLYKQNKGKYSNIKKGKR